MVLGITGGVGCGKSTLMRLLASHYQAKLLIADEIGHEVMEPHTAAWQEIRKTFAGEGIFTEGAETEIYKISTGIPRLINRVCEKALLYACQQEKRLVDEHVVRFVVDHERLVGGAG
ncbi:MAG: dephospho-CoA kinase [Roseburia sp.]|nr:dephospho-CoA kinase [Roseburia sp.]